MTVEVERQLNGILKKQKKLAMTTHDPVERAQVYGGWAGFLAGMKLTGAITQNEYNKFYNEMMASENRKLLA